MADLSQAAYALALRDALLENSLLAKVALMEDEGVAEARGWPEPMRWTAVAVYNEKARVTAEKVEAAGETDHSGYGDRTPPAAPVRRVHL